MQLFFIDIYKRGIFKKIIIAIILWTSIFLVLYYSKTCFYMSKTSLTLFIYTVFPAVFPFILITEFLIQSNLLCYLSIVIDKIICNLFDVSKNSIPVIILGSIFGYPNSIKYATNLLENGKICKKEYTKLLCFTNNPSVIYILSGIGIAMFHSIQIGIILFLSCILSSTILGIFYRPNTYTSIIPQTKIMSNNFYKKKNSYFSILISSIQKTFLSMSFIIAFMVIFSVIPSILCNILNLHGNISKILLGIFEITGGCNNVVLSNLDLKFKVLIVAFILNFSSFMIIFQLYNIGNKYISFKKLFTFKLLQGITSVIVTWLLMQFISIYEYIPTFSNIQIKPAIFNLEHLPLLYFLIFVPISVMSIFKISKMTGKKPAIKGG